MLFNKTTSLDELNKMLNTIYNEFDYLYSTKMNFIQSNYFNVEDYENIQETVNQLYNLLDDYKTTLTDLPEYITDRFIYSTKNIYAVLDSINNMCINSINYYMHGESEGVLVARVSSSAKVIKRFTNQLKEKFYDELDKFLVQITYTDEEEYYDAEELFETLSSPVVKSKQCYLRDITKPLCEISQQSLPLVFNNELLVRVSINYLDNVKLVYPEISKYIMIMGKNKDNTIITEYLPFNETVVRVEYLENNLQIFTLEYDNKVCKMILPPYNEVAKHVEISELYERIR